MQELNIPHETVNIYYALQQQGLKPGIASLCIGSDCRLVVNVVNPNNDVGVRTLTPTYKYWSDDLYFLQIRFC